MLSKDNIIELFAEEMIYRTGRGIIVYLKVEKESCKILEREIMLELDTHLSFPIYIEEGGTIYVYPENYQSGEVRIYEYDEKAKKLLNPRTIIKEPLLDAQIVKIGNNYYAFGVRFRTGSQNDTKELIVYQSDSLLGKYELIQIIENERCEERGAGLIYLEDGHVIRPAQSCEGGYGREVILYELCRDVDGFKERELKRIIPDRRARRGGILHTYNKMKGIVVIDGWAYHRPKLASLYKKMRGIHD